MRARPKRLASLTLLCVLIAQAALVPPAVAAIEQACPSGSVDSHITSWVTPYRQRGITLCWGVNAQNIIQAWVVVVDFEAGAKMRVISEVPSVMGDPQASLPKKTTGGWYDWTIANVGTPVPGLLFGVVNASFFVDAWPWSTSRLSYPEKKWNTVVTPGSNPDLIEKRIFGLGTPAGTGRQSLYLDDWGTQDNNNNLQFVQGRLAPYFDALVSMHPDQPIGTTNNRTYIGTKSSDNSWTGTQDRAYILVTYAQITNAAAKSILVSDFGSMWNIQMDGGGSSQIWTRDFGHYCSATGVPMQECRPVPNALAFYVAQ